MKYPAATTGAFPPQDVKRLRVCIDARLVSGERGGVEQVIIGMASALSRLDDGDERYLFLVDPGHTAWLEPFVFGPSSLLPAGRPTVGPSGRSGLKGRIRQAVKTAIPAPVRTAIRHRMAAQAGLPDSDGTIERAGADVLHFPMQVGFRTAVPTIFAPQDLQHLHLPEFFTRREIARRERTYRALCERASIVTVMSSWGRDDIVARYGLAPEKVLVVPGAPAIEAYRTPTESALTATRDRFGLREQFALYPAKAWPHKNHLRLVAALKLLRERGIEVPVVFTGAQGGLEAPVLAEATALGVADLVRFIGYVTPDELIALYRMARVMVFPSLFEGWGLPVVEAMLAGVPVACSTATCLPAVTGGAAELFDPLSVAAIADAVARVWRDDRLRDRLATDGRARASLFTWDRSARVFRAAYRELGGLELSDHDRALLDAEPIV